MNKETFAQKNADQYLGCSNCKESHHNTSFCECGRCYFEAKNKSHTKFGLFVECECGKVSLWD